MSYTIAGMTIVPCPVCGLAIVASSGYECARCEDAKDKRVETQREAEQFG